MKIRMLVAMSGTRNGQEWPAKGVVAELPTAEAAHLCAAGIAEPVGDRNEPQQPETAVAPDTSEKRGSRARPRKPRGAEDTGVKE